MAIKFFFILSIILIQCRLKFIENDEPNFDQFTGELIETLENNNDTWLVNFIRKDNAKYISCLVIPVGPRIFIGDPECIYRVSHGIQWGWIIIDLFHNGTRFEGMAFIKMENIFYNSNLTREYDPKLRKIAIIITNQPVVADNSKTELNRFALRAYNNIPGYNEKSQIKEIPGSMADIEDIDFSRCFMSPIRGKNIVLRCTYLDRNFVVCHFYKTEYSISQYKYLLDFLMCHVKSSKDKVFLTGLLTRINKPRFAFIKSNVFHKRMVDLRFHLVDDVSLTMRRKIWKWFDENP